MVGPKDLRGEMAAVVRELAGMLLSAPPLAGFCGATFERWERKMSAIDLLFDTKRLVKL